MGNRYSKEEQERIKALVAEGFTNREIAAQLNRTEAAIRNQRHRMKLQAETKTSLQSLLRKKKALSTKVMYLKSEVRTLQERREDISKILGTEEEALTERLTTALTRLKDERPELYQITGAEQIGKLAGTLTAAFIKWLFS